MSCSVVSEYQRLVAGQIKRMPSGSWKQVEDVNKVIRYLMLEKLGLSKQEIPKVFNIKFIEKYKLRGMYILWSPSLGMYGLLKGAFPEFDYQPWDMPNCPYEVWFNPVYEARAEQFLMDKYGNFIPEEAYDAHGMAGLLHKKKTRT